MWGLGPRLEAGCDSFKSAGGIKEKGVASNPTSTQKIVAQRGTTWLVIQADDEYNQSY